MTGQSAGACRAGFADPAAFERAYLAAAIRAGTGDTGMLGLRLMWPTVPDLLALLDRIFPHLPDDAARLERAFGPIRYLHLSRQNKVAQAVSRLRAEQGGLWHRAADGSERERTAPPQPPVYDATRLRAFFAEAETGDAAWNEFFTRHAISPLRLTYEALAAAPQATLAATLADLGLDPALATNVAPRTARLADELSLDWSARFRREAGLA